MVCNATSRWEEKDEKIKQQQQQHSKNNPVGRAGSRSPWATKSLILQNKFSWLKEQGS